MKLPRLSLPICNMLSITPFPTVIRAKNFSITIRIAMEFHVCCTKVKMMQPKTMSARMSAFLVSV